MSNILVLRKLNIKNCGIGWRHLSNLRIWCCWKENNYMSRFKSTVYTISILTLLCCAGLTLSVS